MVFFIPCRFGFTGYISDFGRRMHPFREYILKFAHIPDEEWAWIEKCLTRKEYPAGEILLESGKICRKLYFIEEGLLRFLSLRMV